MLYSIQCLMHKVGLLGKPGADPGEVDKGAASDRTDGQVTEHGSGPTNIESLQPQNSGVRALDGKLLKAARLHIGAGQLEVDSQFSFAQKYVCPSQLVPLTGASAMQNAPLVIQGAAPTTDLAIFTSKPGLHAGMLQIALPAQGKGPFVKAATSGKAAAGKDFFPSGRRVRDEQLTAVQKPTASIRLGDGPYHLYVFQVPQGMEGYEYVSYADWMERYEDVAHSRKSIRALLFGSTLTDTDPAELKYLEPASSGLLENQVTRELKWETGLTLASFNDSLANVRPLLDDTPGHDASVYMLQSVARCQLFTKLIGGMVKSGDMDRAGELTFLAAVVVRLDNFNEVFAEALPEDLGLQWGKHSVHPSECLYAYLRSDPTVRLDVSASGKSMYNALGSPTMTEANLRGRSHRAIHELTRKVREQVHQAYPNCSGCNCPLLWGADAGQDLPRALDDCPQKQALRGEIHHASKTVATIHNEIVAPHLSPALFYPPPHQHQFVKGPVRDEVLAHLITPDALVGICYNCHAIETAATNRAYVPPKPLVNEESTAPCTAYWVAQAL